MACSAASNMLTTFFNPSNPNKDDKTLKYELDDNWKARVPVLP